MAFAHAHADRICSFLPAAGGIAAGKWLTEDPRTAEHFIYSDFLVG